MHIRDFTPDDYSDLVAVYNAIYPNEPSTPQDWIERDQKSDPICKHRRWVAEQDGRMVAVAHYGQSSWLYHPQKFYVFVYVHPAYWGQGIGSQMYNTLIAALADYDPIELESQARDDHPRAVRWLEQRGYREYLREQQSILDVTTCDLSPLAELETRLAARGITLKSYPELADDPVRDQKLYELDMTLTPDIPGTDGFTPPSIEQWRKDILDRSRDVHGGLIVALHGETYIGFSNIVPSRATPATLYTDLTGVRREYRRQGIATALKLRVIQWAKANGKLEIRTENAETNPMLQLNYQLGFRPAPTRIKFRKEL